MSTRACWAVVLALLLAMRLLTSAGFMPAWSAGQLSLVACDDAGAQVLARSAHREHAPEDGTKDGRKQGQTCPYAIASAQAWVDADPTVVVTTAFAAPILQLAAEPVALPSGQWASRPPSTGPPVQA